jgi:hypothetical protein
MYDQHKCFSAFNFRVIHFISFLSLKKSGFLMVSVHQLTFRIGNNHQTIGIESIALPAKRRALMGSSGTKTSLLGGLEPFGNLNHLGHI